MTYEQFLSVSRGALGWHRAEGKYNFVSSSDSGLQFCLDYRRLHIFYHGVLIEETLFEKDPTKEIEQLLIFSGRLALQNLISLNADGQSAK